MQIISKMLVRQEVTNEGLPEDKNIDDISFFKYAPITYVKVEKKFFYLQNFIIGQSPIFYFHKY